MVVYSTKLYSLTLLRSDLALSYGFDLSPKRCAAARFCRWVMGQLATMANFATGLFGVLAAVFRSPFVCGVLARPALITAKFEIALSNISWYGALSKDLFRGFRRLLSRSTRN